MLNLEGQRCLLAKAFGVVSQIFESSCQRGTRERVGG
jgi:hypothetical protein